MMSPRSFLYSGPRTSTSTGRPKPPPPSPTPSPSPSPSRTPSNTTTPTSSPPSHVTTSASSLSSLTRGLSRLTSTSSLSKPLLPPTPETTAWGAKHDRDRLDTTTVTVTPLRFPSADAVSATQNIYADMGKRKDRRGASSLAPSSPPSTTTSTSTAVMTRPTTPTSPVQIPKNANREMAHPPKRHHSGHHAPGYRRQHRDMQTPDSISPSVAALLAVTDIPRPRQRRRRRSDKPMTVGDFMDGSPVSEKELSWSLGRGPMDMLLSPPEDLEDDMSISGSAMSTRTVSVDSIPSLGDSFATDLASSLDTPGSPSPSLRRRGPSPMRKSLEPVHSPPGAADEHPLAPRRVELDLDEADFSTLEPRADAVAKSHILQPFKPLKSVFRSNLTASLRALRSAAKSFSSLNFPVLPADDFLTRSMLTIDPNVPYTDERRPPVTEEMPSAELRRYLNPTTSSRIETPPTTGTPPPGTFSASIQMQTYKVHRSRSTPPASRSPTPSTSSSSSTYQPQPQSPSQTAFSYPPGMRQREMRENSDFIRIAVMEMAMRKRGKLDDQKPGRARWALPPRRTSMKEYEIGSNGVPARWTPVSY